MFPRLTLWLMLATSGLTASLLILWHTSVAHADTITVTSVGDSGTSTLRQAILDLNERGVVDPPHTIRFQVRPGQCNQATHVCTIILLSQLPAIRVPMTLDALSQGGPGYTGHPLIELNGANAGAIGIHGLTVYASHVTIQGFAINRFSGNGIQIDDTPQAGQPPINLRDAFIRGNYIGTDAFGTEARGNGFAGVAISGGTGHAVGGAHGDLTSLANVISGNRVGVLVTDSAHDNGIFGNIIGGDASGVRTLGNVLDGIMIDGASVTVVGAVTPSFGVKNRILGNGRAGVTVTRGSTNVIGDNDFLANSSQGIDLGGDGPTNNDNLDADDGPNGYQNYPEITSARVIGASTRVTGRLLSTPDAENYQIRLYLDGMCVTGGSAQGQLLSGEAVVEADGRGRASFEITVPTALPVGTGLTATATRTYGFPFVGDTSEFSPCRQVTQPAVVFGNAGQLETTEAGSVTTVLVSLSVQPTAEVMIPLSSSNTSEGIVSPAMLTFTPDNWNVGQSVTIQGVDDQVGDGDIAYTVRTGPIVSSDAGYSGRDPDDIQVINRDNDGTPTLSIADATVIEGNTGTTQATFTVTLEPTSTQTVRVVYATAFGTARRTDYIDASGTLTFAPGETTKTFRVAVVGDTVVEPDEEYSVTLSSPQNAAVGRAVARGVITNDDTATGPPNACSPRPNPRIQTSQIGPGRLQVTVTAATTAALTTNAVQRIDFDAAENARVEILGAAPGSPGGPATSGGPAGTASAFSISLPPGTTTTTFFVQRQQPGAFRSSFAVIDGCSSSGPFRTFVGGGAKVT